jgi:TetR/AcrR family tetracycline transcriptional repressor
VVAAKLNRDVIARAGLDLLDKSGIDGVTLRELAAELGVQAPTLYWHVKSKRDIFSAMAVAISQAAAALMSTTDAGAPWQERLTSWAQALRQSIGMHRDGGRVFAGTFAPDPATFYITEASLRAWQDAGLSPAEAARRSILMRHFVVGFCIEEQELAELGDEARREDVPTRIDPTLFPLTAQALPTVMATSADERFQLGVQLMLADV